MWLIFSLLAALSFGVRGILYQWSSKKPVNRNLMLFGVFVMGAVLAGAAAFISGSDWSLVSGVGCLMGVWSFAGNASMYKGYEVGKASLVALFTGLPPVVVVILAYLLWGETLTYLQMLAFLLIIAGILFIRYSSDISLGDLKGIHWAVLSLFSFGLNDTTTTQAMRMEADLFTVAFFMFATGALLFAVFWLKGRIEAGMQPVVGWKAWPTFFWGMTVGITNFLGMYFIMNAFGLGIAGLVSAVTSLNVLIILVYAGLFLKERFRLKEWVGGTLALAGILMLHLAG